MQQGMTANGKRVCRGRSARERKILRRLRGWWLGELRLGEHPGRWCFSGGRTGAGRACATHRNRDSGSFRVNGSALSELSGAWFLALEWSRFREGGSRRGAGGGVSCPQIRVECGVFDPIRMLLGRVDYVQRDVPDQIVLADVLPVGLAHNDPKKWSVGVVDVVG